MRISRVWRMRRVSCGGREARKFFDVARKVREARMARKARWRVWRV